MISKYPNLIVMQTFSKAFGLAAVRVGMAFAEYGYYSVLSTRLKPPYNISTINQKAAIAEACSNREIKTNRSQD
ncbi:MAG: aminotransferase class I/II-fold pyridoxal phosphate-dependent enzyme [Marinilabiliales bacterium]|nr:aminotransferase class I/II-fold pyridoxal phosphate-dependent enzyme [Marinilabiliales bacterium]